MTAKKWTESDIAVLRSLYADGVTADIAAQLGRSPGSVQQQAQIMGIRKSPIFFASTASTRIKLGGLAKTGTRFQPGHKTWNKGIKFESGGRSHETQFKTGERTGAAAFNWVPIGTYRANNYGCLDQKVTDLGRGPKDWEAVHRVVWKAANGPIPPGHIIVFKPGKKTTEIALITADVLDCITRAENAKRNSPYSISPEIGRLCQLKGAINRQVNRIKQESKSA